MKEKTRDNLLSLSLLGAGFIWGLGFIGVEYALRSGLSPALVNAFRFSIAGVLVLVFFWKEVRTLTKSEVKMGLLPGICMMGGFLLQASGQQHTDPANVAFLTAMYIVFVPFFSKVISKRKIGLQRIVAALITFVGIGVLSLGSIKTGSFGWGEILSFAGAVVFALHFISLEKPSKSMSPIKLTFLQMVIAAAALVAYAVAIEPESFATLGEVKWQQAILALLFLGVFSSFIAYLIQTNAQKYVSPSKTAILMSTECPLGGAFSVMFGFASFSYFLLVGGAITMVGVLLTEIKVYWFDRLEKKIQRPKSKATQGEIDG